jgi:hypothetical protein
MSEVPSKSDVIKKLAIEGNFKEIETLHGSKAKEKAKQYVSKSNSARLSRLNYLVHLIPQFDNCIVQSILKWQNELQVQQKISKLSGLDPAATDRKQITGFLKYAVENYDTSMVSIIYI